MSRLKDIPELARDGGNLGAVMSAIREAIQTFRGYRGDPLDEALTRRNALSIGILNPDGTAAVVTGSVGATGPVGPAGPSGATYTPDLSAPPTPTGLAVTAGLASIFIECDTQAYTEGHGHDRTIVYGAKWPSGIAPTFSSAVELFEFQGTFGAYPTETGTRWCIWIKWLSMDAVLSTSPAGGTNGVQATTGKIGNTDLGPLIIEAGNLAAGAVTTAKFAAGIEPVSIVTGSLPVVLSTQSIFLTSNGKLYRWNGTAYVSTVPTTDLTGTVLDAQIAGMAAAKVTGTLTDGQLDAISAAKVTGTLTNAQIADLAATKITGQITTTQITDDAVTSAKVVAGAITAGKIAANAVTATEILAGSITTAKIAAGAITTAEIAAGTIVAGDIAAGTITATEIAGGTITGAKIAAGTILAGNIAAGAITASEIAAGTITASQIAAGTITATQIAASTITAGQIAAGAISATEIAAGAITATKIGANAIAVGTAAIQNGAIVNAMIGTAEIDDAKIGNLSAAKLTAGTGVIGGNLSSSNYVAGVSGWLVTPAGYFEAQDAVLRGTVYASNGSFSGTVTIKDTGGNTVFTSGASVAASNWLGNVTGTVAGASASALVSDTALALSKLTDIASDSKFTPTEKIYARTQWNIAASEKAGINAQSAVFSITTEDATYNTKFIALGTYLNAGSGWSTGIPFWIRDAGLNDTETITGSAFRLAFTEFYDARTALLNKIAAAAVHPGNKITSVNASTFITASAIGNTQIGGTIMSTDFVSGSAGWAINKAGAAEFSNAVFRGSLVGADITGTTGTFSGSVSAGSVNFASSVGTTTVYSTPGTYTLTVPAVTTSMKVTMWGGGGGGAGGGTWSFGAGAGGGKSTIATITLSGLTPGATYSITVGAGGSGGAAVAIGGVGSPGVTGNAGAPGGASVLTGYGSSSGGSAGTTNNTSNPRDATAPYSGSGHSGTNGQGVGGGAGGVYEGYYFVSYNTDAGDNATGYGNGGGGGASGGNFGDGSTAGGAGSSGRIQVEFYDPNGVVLRAEMALLKTELRAQGLTIT